MYVRYPSQSELQNTKNSNYNHHKTVNNFKKCNVNNFNFQNFHSATNLFYTENTNQGNLSKNTTLTGQKMAHLKEPSVPTKLYTVPDQKFGYTKQSFEGRNGQRKPTGIVCPKVVEMDINRNFHSSARILKKI